MANERQLLGWLLLDETSINTTMSTTSTVPARTISKTDTRFVSSRVTAVEDKFIYIIETFRP